MAYKIRVSDTTQEMVYELLKDEADLDGITIVSQAHLADKLGFTPTTVGAAVQYLVNRGLVTDLGSNTIHNIHTLQIVNV